MKRGTDSYLFRHSNTSSESPFQREHPYHWAVEWDSNTRLQYERKPSLGDTSLLTYLLNLRGVPATATNINIFARAGLWADLTLTRNDDYRTLQNYKLTSVLVEVDYDFRDQPSSLVVVDASTGPGELIPLIAVSKTDLADRSHGFGRLHRTYGKGFSTVQLTTPQSYGQYEFKQWTDCFGYPLSNGKGTTPTLTLTLNQHWAVQAQYVNTDTNFNGVPDEWEAKAAGRYGFGNFINNPILLDSTPTVSTNGLIKFNLVNEWTGTISIHVSTNLINWMTLTNYGGTNRTIEVQDSDFRNYPRRFYRAIGN